ncbi:ATP-grasp domain-containing protein [Aureivirga marina]|uniref:ATP-grasp domain-containing protein n=1 Tax=Aureivirga marina TaxID=1182451 RepID=UPI0018C95D30|nr:ATP-grasp domain-containing protein [Aureivirga marina]
MVLLFCDSVFDRKIIEPDYEKEQQIAKKYGFQTYLISHEELTDNHLKNALRFIPTLEEKEIGMFRGWMLTPNQYEKLYNRLLEKNIQLINSPKEYKHAHYLPESFELIKEKSPFSIWFSKEEFKDFETIFERLKVFENEAVIIKDFVKSEKHAWKEACFIPNFSDKENVRQIVSKFIELRGNYLNEGLVFRKFEHLKFLKNHSKSNMPLTKEFRVFFYKNQIVQIAKYWDEGIYGEENLDFSSFIEIANRIESNFFSMDIAQKENGEWIIMEIGDGQVSGFPDNLDKVNFYKNIKKIQDGIQI